MIPYWTNRPRRFRERRPSLETLPEYASRVLRFAIVAGPYILTPAQRGLADMAAQRAQGELTGPDPKHPERLDEPGQRILERLSMVRHQIARMDAYARTQIQTASTVSAPQGGTSPGRPAPIVTPPKIEPPRGSYADARPNLRDTRVPADGIRF